VVSENLDYWRLMYIDVVEFRHKHFIHSFREIAGGLRTYANAVIRESKVVFPPGVDPSLAYTAIYLQFFTYFLAEELFGAKRYLGTSDVRPVNLAAVYEKKENGMRQLRWTISLIILGALSLFASGGAWGQT